MIQFWITAKIVQRKQNCGGPGEIQKVEFEDSMIDGVALVIYMDFYRENEEPVWDGGTG